MFPPPPPLAGMGEKPKKKKVKRGRATTARIWPCSQNSKACLQAMMGGMDVAAVASPWIMEGWLASFHRPCRASNLPAEPASKTCCCVEPFLFAFGTAESSDPSVTTGTERGTAR